jgi:hypothetical protein
MNNQLNALANLYLGATRTDLKSESNLMASRFDFVVYTEKVPQLLHGNQILFQLVVTYTYFTDCSIPFLYSHTVCFFLVK